jgi:hypothetical protein
VCAPQGGRGFAATSHSCKRFVDASQLQATPPDMLQAPAVRLRCRLPPLHEIASPVAWFPFAPADKLVLQRVVRRFATAGLPRAPMGPPGPPCPRTRLVAEAALCEGDERGNVQATPPSPKELGQTFMEGSIAELPSALLTGLAHAHRAA